ncbi:nucleoside triphosphate pyrophosphohydrolase [Neptuniibacter caesariensis]|uniref:Nucleoside triphosphate pyrophosphohydrolase n=1 Tax=Neptuniibacter caesariensis TaxID=207954 RepID=A0A7U8C2P7_NEPCE|nr:nucleoside triphosphate pyrophosphohydrolase [Neptuniibacter caesariensis]EAR60390.1 MazG [Oceanospirillum sp. MED92] [Neptuniibacter caesariensis]
MQKYTIEDLLYLMGRLRDPELGCPWDVKQDFASIVPHTLEEAYEVADAIAREDWEHLNDELGDLLFQVIFYAQMGSEKERFDFSTIVSNLVEKLVRRHPHVFPDGSLQSDRSETPISEEEIKRNWEAIKLQERNAKETRGISRVLDDVPRALPGLSRAVKLQKRAAQVGFDWNEAEAVLDKMEEELAELREAIAAGDKEAIADEMGDMIFAQVNLARHLGVNPEDAVRGTNQKFERRFNHVEDRVLASGRPWNQFTLQELDSFWDEAKEKGL